MAGTGDRIGRAAPSAAERPGAPPSRRQVAAAVAGMGSGPLDSADGRGRDALVERLTVEGVFRLTADGEPGSPVRAEAVVEALLLVARLSPSIAQVVQTHYSALAAVERYVHLDGRPVAGLPGGRYVQMQSESAGATGSAVASTLRRTPDGFRLDGAKDYVTGIEWAQWLNTGAWYEGRKVQVILPRSAPGVSVTPTWAAFGQRDTESNRVDLRDVPVDPDRVYVPDGVPPSPVTKLGHAAIDIGIGEAALHAFRHFLLRQARVRNDAAASGIRATRQDPYLRRQFGYWAVELAALRARLFELAAAIGGGTSSAPLAGPALPSPSAPPDQGADPAVRIRAFAAYAGETAVRLTSDLFSNAGGRAAGLDRGLDAFWRDARVHTLLNPRDWGLAELGGALLDEEDRDDRDD